MKSKKLSKKSIIVLIILIVLSIIAGALFAVYSYYDGLLQEKGSGTLPDEVKPADNATPDVLSFLVCGIDYSVDEHPETTSDVGKTDVIIYCRYDTKNGKLSILQIPRDTYIGEDTSTGKINLLYAHGPDKVNRMANLASKLKTDFGLDTENYAAFDLDAFVEIIDALGGIDMYVPWDVKDEYGNVITEGTHRLTGASAVFVIRQRDMYAQKDIKRLEMQQYFYKAVINAVRDDFSLSDVPNMASRVMHYCSTDFNLMQLATLFPQVMSLKNEDIFIARCPGGSMSIDGEAVFAINAENLATLLNEHFRDPDKPISASELKIPTGFDYALGEINDKGNTLSGLGEE